MRRKEKGFGVITLTVTIAVAAIIALGAGMTIIQVIRGTERNEEYAEVVRQSQNLGRWFNRDALTTENITIGDNPGTGDEEFLTIFWRDWESGETYDIRYLWLDDADSLKQVKRNQVMRDKDGAIIESTTSLIANSIYSANISQQDSAWTLCVEARSGQRSETREYKITKRLHQ